ncbi:MAG: FG-GAP repeat protein, partial [Phycisphaerae bacterium]
MTSKPFIIGCVLGLGCLVSPAVAQPVDCNGNGIEDGCELDCGEPGGPCDVPGCGTGTDCNGDGVPDECGLLIEQAKLTADDAAAGDWFGNAVSISGDTAVIGSPLDDDGVVVSGSATVFVRTGGVWTQQAKLTAADAAEDDWFGNSVAISGDTIVVGSPLDKDAGFLTGSAYVFVRTGGVWTQQAKLTAADAAAEDWFGRCVSISGDTVVIGSPFDDDAGSKSGSAYVFVRTAGVWAQQAKLTADDAATIERFGFSVSIDVDTAVIGSLFDETIVPLAGSAYVFVRTGDVWTQQAKLTAPDATVLGNFGFSVSIGSDTAIIGALSDDEACPSDPDCNSGAAYVFIQTAGVWTQEAKLTAPDSEALDNFGFSVSISGDTAVIGSPFDNDAGNDSGSTYVFIRSGGVWSQPTKLTAADGADSDLFGFSVSISGGTAVIGAQWDDDAGASSGSAYVYSTVTGSIDCQADGIPDECQLAGNDCNADSVPDDCQLDGNDCNADGIPDECQLAGNDCNADGVPDDCQLDDNDCNTDGVPDVCQLAGNDCNADGFPDDCQLAGNDCNADGIPDECQFLGGDCNADGVPDECQLVDNDCNVNGIPDECDIAPFARQVKLTAADATSFSEFGISVSISDDTAVIGSDSASAYVFVRTGNVWIQQAKLTVADPGGRFGFSVSISGETAVIGAPLGDAAVPHTGSAYVFVRSNGVWTQQAKLTADDATFGDHFGNSVSITGDTAVIGAWRDDAEGTLSGSAYVFVRSNGVWTQQAKLTADDAVPGAFFGWSVSINGNTAVIGSFHDDHAGAGSGSAYVFVRTAGVWTLQTKLTAADAATSDEFGASVSIDGDTVAIGSRRDDDAGFDSGSVYVFVRTAGAWTLQAEFNAADTAAGDEFGTSVSISGDTAVIGARGDDDACPMNPNCVSGSAYVFVRTGTVWTQQAKISAADAARDDLFGHTVSISGDTAVIGAFRHDDVGFNSGSAYVFSAISSDCQIDGIPDDCQLEGNDCNGNGIPDECEENPLDTVPPVIACEIVPVTGDDSEDSEDSDDSGDSEDEGGGGGEEEEEEVVGGAHPTEFAILFDAVDDCGEVEISAVVDIGCRLVPVENGTVVRLKCKDTCRVREKDDRLDIKAAAAILIVTAVDESGNTSSCEVVLCVPPDDSGDDDSEDDGLNDGDVDAAYPLTIGPTIVNEDTKLLASDGMAFDWFGASVAISGDTIVVGARLDDENGSDSGSAYVFVRSGTGWSEQAKLQASDGAAFDRFGTSVSISGDTIVVGSPFSDDNGSLSGSAYVFVRSGTSWSEQVKLLASDNTGGDVFGFSVSISVDTIVIGASADDDNGSASGSAYVFVRSGTSWSEQAKLLASDGEAIDSFGHTVAISGDTIVAGSPFDNDNGSNSGSAYVFVRSGTSWSEQAELHASDGDGGLPYGDTLGSSVAVSGDTIVVGAWRDTDNGIATGSAYVFEEPPFGWVDMNETVKLLPSDGAANGMFGITSAISSDTIAVGASFDNDNGLDSGSAYVFVRSGMSWSEQVKQLASDGDMNDRFGFSVAISGDTIVVGANNDDDNGSNSGSAYVFSFGDSTPPMIECPLDVTLVCGESIDPSNTGEPIVTDDDPNVTVTFSDIVEPGDSPQTPMIMRTWTANDSAGNSASCDQIISVVDTMPPEIACEIVPVSGDDSEDSEDSDDSDDSEDGGGGGGEEEEVVGGAHPTLFTILFDAVDDCGAVEISAVVDIGCMQVPVENGTVVRLKCKDECRVREKDDRLDIEAAAAILIVTAVDESGNTS